MLLFEMEIYGLLSGPSWLRASLKVDLLAAGYVKNLYDRCLFTLFSNEDTSEGQVLVDVDDFIEGGKEPHCKAMVANPLLFPGESCNIATSVSLCPWMNT